MYQKIQRPASTQAYFKQMRAQHSLQAISLHRRPREAPQAFISRDKIVRKQFDTAGAKLDKSSFKYSLNLANFDLETSLKPAYCAIWAGMIRYLKLHNLSSNKTATSVDTEAHSSNSARQTKYPVVEHNVSSRRSTDLNLTFLFIEGSKRQQQLDEALVAMITGDFQPLSIVEDTGFRRFVSLLDLQYSVPNRKKLRLMIEDDYHKQKEAVNLAVEDSTCVSLTTDIWTSLNSEAYIAVTGHFINTNWCLKALALETFRFPEKHTALNISEALDNTISKWNVENKVVSITTDNASNMTAAVQLIHSGNIDMQHVPCLAHTINLVVKSSLNSNSELCIMREKARKIVSYFKTSCNANDHFSKNSMRSRI
ncbi:E3 SUMO-protein ligase ZBED1-like [Schistocerca serialis cubense]|uniref:E3 SUMO-protein ligase ZBED1-like n=1 Tax=Schistocerca serialis cubense TaxID=2023355 RepID=UPI00214F2E15|nr:E3 SUMO-protein ligase ZBED1-like [Schistocerca serialis cubense]